MAFTVVHILGTRYTVKFQTKKENEWLANCDGYCDYSSKEIVVVSENPDIGNFEMYKKKVLRHEIIHAFLYESGLCENLEHKNLGHEETMVDWMAFQFPKIIKAFEDVGAL